MNHLFAAGARGLGRWLAPGGMPARLSILIYHRVLPAPDPLQPEEIDVRVFTDQMRALTQCFTVLPLDEALRRLYAGTLPARSACVTFDDGYADNHDVAVPILQQLGAHATFFIATGHLDGGRMWNDSVIEAVRRAAGSVLDLTTLGLGTHSVDTPPARGQAALRLIAAIKHLPADERARQVAAIERVVATALPSDLMMTRSQVRALHAVGMGIGAHTVSHPILTRIDSAAARREIADGRDELEGIIGTRVRLFAYPNGRPGRDYGPEHVDIVRDIGFDAALTTAWGVATRAGDRHQIPRFTPWDRTPNRFVTRLLRNALRQTAATV